MKHLVKDGEGPFTLKRFPLLSATVNGTSTLFLAFRDSYANEFLATTTDGSNWILYAISGAAAGVYSPNMTLSSDGSTIYIGYMSGSTYNPILCSVNAANPNTQNCQNLTGLRTMNFNPDLAIFRGELYVGFEDRRDSHCLYFDRGDPSTNSFSLWESNNDCPEQTSSAPSLVLHNNDLYIAFRTNDSSQKFTVRVTTTGSDFGYRQQPGWAMDGPPGLVDLTSYGTSGIMAVFSRSSTLEHVS